MTPGDNHNHRTRIQSLNWHGDRFDRSQPLRQRFSDSNGLRESTIGAIRVVAVAIAEIDRKANA